MVESELEDDEDGTPPPLPAFQSRTKTQQAARLKSSPPVNALRTPKYGLHHRPIGTPQSKDSTPIFQNEPSRLKISMGTPISHLSNAFEYMRMFLRLDRLL